MSTIKIDNFKGSMVPQINGDMNSGNSYWLDVFGYDPFTKPGNLTWEESPVQIDSGGSVITDLIVAGKTRVESGIIYVYAVGHTGRVYKIQVNNPATYNPDYDNPVLLTTITSNSPTLTMGGSMNFFGSTERIYIGHDKGITRIDFDGTNESFVGLLGSYTQNVPRIFQQFLGKLYFGNGSNIGEIDSTATVTTYAKLSPGFPTNSQVRDISLTADGNYMQIVVAESAMSSILATIPSIPLVTPSNSYIFKWNGIDQGYTASTFFPNTVLTANIVSTSSEYTFGYDFFSNAVYNPTDKILSSLPDVIGGSTPPNGKFAIGNLVVWAQNLVYLGNLIPVFQMYGTLGSYHGPSGFWAPAFPSPTSPETDILQIPLAMMASSIGRGQDSNGYTDGIYSTPKIYYSTLETSSAPTTAYRFYRMNLYPTGLGTPINGALFQTQNQVFSRKISIKEVRVYAQPWVANNGFTVSLIGSNDQDIPGSSYTFTAGSNLPIGEDFAMYNPDTEPVYSLALRIVNNGTKNFIINKVEIDYEEVKG